MYIMLSDPSDSEYISVKLGFDAAECRGVIANEDPLLIIVSIRIISYYEVRTWKRKTYEERYTKHSNRSNYSSSRRF